MGLFGKKPEFVPAPYIAPPQPQSRTAPTMDHTIHNTEMRAGNLQARVAQLEADIANFKREMSRHPKGTASYRMYHQRAIQAMKQRKRLEGRLQNTMAVQFNLEHVRDAKSEMQDHVATVDGLRVEAQELQAFKDSVDLDEAEDLQDEIQDALEDASEVSNVLGRTYDVGVVDDAELEAELDALEESPTYADPSSVPTYLQPTPVQGAGLVQQQQHVQPQHAPHLPAQAYQPQGMGGPRY